MRIWNLNKGRRWTFGLAEGHRTLDRSMNFTQTRKFELSPVPFSQMATRKLQAADQWQPVWRLQVCSSAENVIVRVIWHHFIVILAIAI